jgi:hypothetical protein
METQALEARFDLNKSFAMYGEPSLMLCLHLTVLTDRQFMEKYKTTKAIVKTKMAELEMASQRQDYVARNNVYNFFIEVL